MKRFPTLPWLLVAAAGAMGYACYQQHSEQTRLNAQLDQLDQLLMADNDDADHNSDNAVKGIGAAVQKNQNQPQEVSILAAAQHLNRAADSLTQTLRGLADELRHPAGTRAEPNPTPAHLGKTGAADKLLGPSSAAGQSLQQQLAGYRSALQALNPTEKLELSEPQFAGMPVVAALASLSQLESEAREAELHAFRYLTPKVGAKKLLTRLVALHSAESNVVAPGETYRAELFLGGIMALRYVPMQMRCNGQPVSVDSNSVGLVRFRAPFRPGPAVWTGSIRFNANGRDTTFQVRVPYRVARR